MCQEICLARHDNILYLEKSSGHMKQLKQQNSFSINHIINTFTTALALSLTIV